METLSPFSAAVEHFDLTVVQKRVKTLPDIPGDWPNRAGLERFDQSKMSWAQFRRFNKKIEFHDFGHVPDSDSVWSKFREPCWIWTGGLHDKGYGRFHLGMDPVTNQKVTVYTHRISFEHFVTIPPPGYIVDHECNVKTCCNPVHLWPVSNPENIRLADLRRPWKRRNQYSKE